MTDPLESQLRDTLTRLGRHAPAPPLDGAQVRHTVRLRRTMTAAPLAVAVAVLGILAVVVLPQRHGDSAASPGGSACTALHTGPLPQWARAGFSGRSYPPFAYSNSGNIVAVVFGNPLTSPPASDHNNKILWVMRNTGGEGGGAADFRVTARLEGSDTTRTMQIPTGPSLVDMPAAGCWQLTLHWEGRSDTINLRWHAP